MLTLPQRMRQVLRPFEEVKSRTHLGMGQRVAHRSHPGPRRANGCWHFAGHGMREGEAVPELSPGAQARHMVEPGAESPLVASAGEALCGKRCPAGDWH